MRYIKNHYVPIAYLVIILFVASVSADAQVNTAFNFQGRLNDGSTPANGVYDLRFTLFDAIAGGSQVGQPFFRFNTNLRDGVLSTVLDFGPIAFDQGQDRYIEIALKPSGSPNPFVILGPRQQILRVPYSINSIYSAIAGLANSATVAQSAADSVSLGGVPAGNYARLNFDNPGNIKATGNIEIAGVAKQPAASFGFPKAMIYVDGLGFPVSCYNGVTGASSGGCGFSVQEAQGLAGVYNIDFGFNVRNRFVILTAEYGATQNKGANFRFITDTRIDVWTFFTDERSNTARTNFMIIVY
jgi:hypothetical protein